MRGLVCVGRPKYAVGMNAMVSIPEPTSMAKNLVSTAIPLRNGKPKLLMLSLNPPAVFE
jgi:hypothetical protein